MHQRAWGWVFPAEPPQLVSAFFFLLRVTNHCQKAASHTFSPACPPGYSHCSGFSSDAQHFTRSCLLFVLYRLVTAAPVLFLEKQLCLWYQRPSILPHCTASKAKAPHLAFGFFPTTCFQLTALASSLIAPPRPHTIVTLVKSLIMQI